VSDPAGIALWARDHFAAVVTDAGTVTPMAAILDALLISWPPSRRLSLAITVDLVLHMLCRRRHRRKQPTSASGTLFTQPSSDRVPAA
ncbi:hypothetical protein Dimus_033459, partial [Dionaea muscipula]